MGGRPSTEQTMDITGGARNETTTEFPFNSTDAPEQRDWPMHIKIHGFLLILAWLVMSCISIIFNRYYKSVWPKKTLCGKPMWFQLHRITMVLVALLTLVAVVLACVYSGTYDSLRDFTDEFLRVHPPSGIAICVLVFFNPALAFFRPPLDSKYRNVWFFLHFAIGITAYVLANVNVWMVYRQSRDISPTLGKIFRYFLFFYWALVCLTVVVLETNKWYWHCRSVSAGREHEPLNEDGLTGDAGTNKGGVKLLKVWFCFFVFFVLVAFVGWMGVLFYPGGMYTDAWS